MATEQQGNNQQQGQETIKVDTPDAHIEITPNSGGQSGGNRATASNGQGAQDNRGKVLHPETDGRLKGNEANRPNDPDRSAQRAGAQKGGENSRGGNQGNNE